LRSLLYILIFISNVLVAQDTLTYSKLSTIQYQQWEEIESKWRKEEFASFLKRNNIKMDCAKCTSVYTWIVFKCDSSGTTFSMIKNKKCGEEMKGKQLSEFKKIFEKIKLPETFINTFLKVYMGNELKC